MLSACATTSAPPKPVEAPVSKAEQHEAQEALKVSEEKVFKRKIAIARFSNETRYGRTFLRDDELDPLGKQVSDMLASRLVESGKFLVFERQDLGKIKKEQEIVGQANLIGVDTLILGSLTEFGRSTTGKTGFLSGTKMQTARAKVETRLVDPRTGHAFFSSTGTGEASMESGSVAGFGSKADYDATLNDKAIAAAISDMISGLISKMEERPWRTDILKLQGKKVFISGGERQGIKVGDELVVMLEGEKVKSGQSGFVISLPPTPAGIIRISGLFGDSEANEGAVGEIISGPISEDIKSLFVTSKEENKP